MKWGRRCSVETDIGRVRQQAASFQYTDGCRHSQFWGICSLELRFSPPEASAKKAYSCQNSPGSPVAC
jgi:hypothetical protein